MVLELELFSKKEADKVMVLQEDMVATGGLTLQILIQFTVQATQYNLNP